jgi:hypothetical protein
VAREAVLARPRALLRPPVLDPLAGDLDAPEGLLFGALVLDEDVGFFFFEAGDFFAAGRPRAFVPRPDLEPLVFDDLAINDSFELGSPRGSSNNNCGAPARVP